MRVTGCITDASLWLMRDNDVRSSLSDKITVRTVNNKNVC